MKDVGIRPRIRVQRGWMGFPAYPGDRPGKAPWYLGFRSGRVA